MKDFAQTSIQFLKQPPSNIGAMFQKVATRLQTVSRQQVEQSMKALSNLYATATRKDISEEAFALTLDECFQTHEALEKRASESNISKEDFLMVLTELYMDNKDSLLLLFKNQQYGNHYENLQWRLETQLGSRHQKSSEDSHYYFSLFTSNHSKDPLQFSVKDHQDLKRMTRKLDQALKDMKTTGARRIRTYIQ